MLKPFPIPLITNFKNQSAISWDDLADLQPLSHNVSIPETLFDATPKKKADFLAGRYCAQQAIQSLHPHWRGSIERLPTGSPKWPESVVGSITHTKGFAWSVIESKSTCLNVGIDSEDLTNASRLECAKDLILGAHEEELRLQLSMSEAHFTLLVFSMKESLFKCYSPLLSVPLNYYDLSITAIVPENHTFQARVPTPFDSILHSYPYQGQFAVDSFRVYTAITLT